MLTDWGTLRTPSPYDDFARNFSIVDVNSDGQKDIVVVIVDPNDKYHALGEGMLLLFLKQKEGYRLASQIDKPYVVVDPGFTYIPSPSVVGVLDLTKEGLQQIVFAYAYCGASFCKATVDILQWDSAKLRSLMSSPREMLATPLGVYPTIGFQNSGHGTTDLVLHGGFYGSNGAGAQRARKEIYRWNGTAFVLVETTFAPSNIRYFKVVDANALMLAQDYKHAIELYQEAINNPKLELVYKISELDHLQAFSRFRIMVAYTLLGDFKQAQAMRDELLAQQPEHIYAQVAKTFWAAYQPQHNIAAGCNAVTVLARSNKAIPDVLNDFGYANPDFTAEEVCPFK